MKNYTPVLHDKYWISNSISYEEVKDISQKSGISKLLAKVFLSRGINDISYIKSFINPSFDQMHNPFLLKDMDKAVDRICSGIENKEKIVIYGDYDVDGTTATSILLDYLSRLGAIVSYYIPDRMEEGYGVSPEAIDKIAQTGASLIITVDCGITAVDEVLYARSKGIDVIITDHHECKPQLPEACAVIDPWRPDCTYPFKELAGVGVVFKLVNAMNIKLGLEKSYKDYIELTALGTIADVSRLTGENRIIAMYGMESMKSSSNLGLRMLIEQSGLKNKAITTYSVGFVIAPRINAAGRIGDAGRAVRLFTSNEEKEAVNISIELNEENKKRQDTEQLILQEAFDIIESDLKYLKSRILVVADKDWHRGVVGIVSSRVTEKYQRPSILISIEEGMGKGSGRSIEGFNLFKALTHCQHLLDKFGGHELAAGLTIAEENIDQFREAINEYADSVLSDDMLIPRIKVDAYINEQDINLESVRELQKLEPFGPGNPTPVFAYKGLKITDIRTVGQGKHLKLLLNIGNVFVDAIGFNMGHVAAAFSEGDLIDAAFSLEVNSWNNNEKIQLVLRDIRSGGKIALKNDYYYKLDKDIENSVPIKYNRSICLNNELTSWDEIVPDRKDLEAVYISLKECPGRDIIIDNLFIFARKVSKTYGVSMNYFKLKRCIEIFEELELLDKVPLGKLGMYIALEDSSKKNNLENSKIYRQYQDIKNKLI